VSSVFGFCLFSHKINNKGIENSETVFLITVYYSKNENHSGFIVLNIKKPVSYLFVVNNAVIAG
jgi:hypothetical protein